MKVLMFGWEFPPYNSGGLGTACFGLTKGLSNLGTEVVFVLPKVHGDLESSHVDIVDASKAKGEISNISSIKGLTIKKVDSLLKPYMTSEQYDSEFARHSKFSKIVRENPNYGNNLYEESLRYAEKAGFIAKQHEFDVIHAHDWMAYKAGIAAKKATGKPLVLHIHATEFDRTGGNNNQYIYDTEYEGFHAADLICAVSQFTKDKVCHHYGIDPDKVHVVHNAVEFNDNKFETEDFKMKKHHKIVLFLGRITIQKGPDWFLYAAKKVHEVDPEVKFVFAGSGDMELRMIEKAAELGIAHNVIFSGFLRGKDIDRAYQMADLYVMPSISEPFGITPLEAMRNGTPVIISKQSGVSEVIKNCIKIDFWDVDKMAEKILEVVQNPIMHSVLKMKGQEEVMKFNWDEPAAKCLDAYKRAIDIVDQRGGING